MSEFFSSDGPYVLQFLVVFLVILILLMGAWLLFGRIAGRGLSRAARASGRAHRPRLGIVDIYELDRQRQLILLRRDDVEHLLLVGGPNDVVVERDVRRALDRERAPVLADRDAAVPDAAAAVPPVFAMPLAVPVPGVERIPGAASAGRVPPLDPALFEPEANAAERPEVPTRPRGGIAQIGRILRRTPPAVVQDRSEPASERKRIEPAPAEAPSITPPPGEPRSVDPAILSDMARQLETALRRPSSAVTPPPAQPSAAPAPVPAAPAQAAPSSAAASPDTGASATTPRPSGLTDPTASEAATTPMREPDPAAGAQQTTVSSVEEIESEFARLLGRPLDRKT